MELRFWEKSIGSRIVLFIILLIILPYLLVNYIVSGLMEKAIQEQVTNHLTSVSTLKKQEVNVWFSNLEDDVGVLTAHPLVVKEYDEMTAYNGSQPQNSNAYADISSYFNNYLKVKGHFRELFIMDLDGRVVISTDPLQEGKYMTSRPYFLNGKNGTYVQNVYHDISLDEPAITVSTPIRDDRGNVIGVLAGQANLQQLTEFMSERSGLGETGETYLINSYNYFVTEPSEPLLGKQYVLQKAVYTGGVKDCLGHNDGAGLYEDYRGIPVMGVYRWMDDRKMCLLAEVDRAEAFKSINDLNKTMLTITYAVLIFSVLAGLLVSEALVNPIRKLTQLAFELGHGNYAARADLKSKDELGTLSATFNKLAVELQQSRSEIEGYSKGLEEKVEERTRELGDRVDELTNTRLAIMNIMEDLQQAKDELDIKVRERTKELQKAYEDLMESDKVKDDFLAITSHELKTPLTSILGLTQLIREELADKMTNDEKEDIKIVLEEANRLREIIDEILELARLDAGKQVFKMAELNIKSLAEETADELKTYSQQFNVPIKVEAFDVPTVKGDYDSVKRLLTNLINNAIKYSSGRPGKVTAGARRDGDSVVTYIRDNGIGIPDEAKPKIFTRFYQVDSSKSRQYGGTGLGLAICRRIVEAHDGKIWFDSKLGEGSTFYFSLPIFNKGK